MRFLIPDLELYFVAFAMIAKKALERLQAVISIQAEN